MKRVTSFLSESFFRHEFFHTTNERGLLNILKDRKLFSFSPYISFSEVPLINNIDGKIGMSMVIVFDGSIKRQLNEIKYNKRWLNEHPDIVEHITGNKWDYENDSKKNDRLINMAITLKYEKEWLSEKYTDVKFKYNDIKRILVPMALLEEMRILVNRNTPKNADINVMPINSIPQSYWIKKKRKKKLSDWLIYPSRNKRARRNTIKNARKRAKRYE